MLLFDWREAKSDCTLAERGFDFDFASRIWQGQLAEVVDSRKASGEVRVRRRGHEGGRGRSS